MKKKILILLSFLILLIFSAASLAQSPYKPSQSVVCGNSVCEVSTLRLKIGEEKSMEIAGKAYAFKLVNIETTPYQIRVNTEEGEKEFTNYEYKIYYSIDGSSPMLAQEASEKIGIKFDAFIEGAPEGEKIQYAIIQFYEDKICNVPDCAAKVELGISKKWNLVPLYFFSEEMLKKGTCKQDDITVIYAHHPIKNEYVKLYSFGFQSLDLKSVLENFNKEFMAERILAGIFYNSAWVYSRNDCRLVAEIPNQLNNFILLLQQSVSQQQLQWNFAAGWNFWSGTKDIEGKNFDEIKGTCNIEKAFAFDAISQSWKPITSVPTTATNFVFKTTNKCIFGYEQPAPPSMPQ